MNFGDLVRAVSNLAPDGDFSLGLSLSGGPH